MRVWPTFILLVLLAKPSEDPTDSVRNIPKRYSKDWRLFCNVCNHFIWRVGDNLNKSIQAGDEHDFQSRVGFRLDSNGKKHSLINRSIDIRRSIFKITEVMDEDVCGSIKVDAVLYNKKSEKKEGLRMLLKNQKYNKTKEQGVSKKRKYVGKANLYCAEVYQRYYDEVIEAFTNENMGSRNSFCRDYVDSRCPLVTDLPKIVFKSKKDPKRNSTRTRDKKNTSGDLNQEHHNETNTTGDFSTKAEVLGETKSEEKNEVHRQPLESSERGEQSELIENLERSSEESDKPQEPEKHSEL